jgi:cysteine desulfurase
MYLDNAATTQVDKEVINDVTEALRLYYANPSSQYEFAKISARVIAHAREQVAKSINANLEEIYFTSGATESNNWALKGFVDAHAKYDESTYIITTKLEHPSIYNTLEYMRHLPHRYHGLGVKYIDNINNGRIDINSLHKLLSVLRKDDYALISIILANNEIGTIQPIKDIHDFADKYYGMKTFMVDATQAYTHMPIDVKDMGIDVLSASGHKIGLPKGIGFLYIKNGTEISPLLKGGHQMDDMRAGTENVPYIYAFGNQAERLMGKMTDRIESIGEKRDYLYREISKMCIDIDQGMNVNGARIITGDYTHRLCNNLNLTFYGIDAQQLCVLLDEDSWQISTGSACSSGEKTPSRILTNIGLAREDALSTVRITLDDSLEKHHLDDFVKSLRENLLVLKAV